MGGKDGDDNPRQGRCYEVGVEVKLGSSSGGHFAGEYPQHPSTSNFYINIKYASNPQIPDLNGKTFGMQIIGYVTARKTYKMECYLDLSVLDKKVSELTEPPNKWELYFTVEDDGHLKTEDGDDGGEPYLTNREKPTVERRLPFTSGLTM